MQTYLALLRGVNVGGKNRVPMEQLKGILSDVGYSHVHTYINSGNILFSAADGLQPEPLQAQMQELTFTHFGVTTAAAVFQGRATASCGCCAVVFIYPALRRDIGRGKPCRLSSHGLLHGLPLVAIRLVLWDNRYKK